MIDRLFLLVQFVLCSQTLDRVRLFPPCSSTCVSCEQESVEPTGQVSFGNGTVLFLFFPFLHTTGKEGGGGKAGVASTAGTR